MKCEIETSKKFKKQFKKLSSKNANLVLEIIEKLLNGEVLEQKYNDYKLKGNYKDFRECHIKPDLLLIYKKKDEVLILTCIDLGSHSELFRK
ncbi:type II toxin-antitoxin system YafQ family toxin [Brachyspira aalborgi]|uniref:Type II toxin-antitoxin system YafQ family toxin n=1 Tax=Brachyspira aalborgi TaxID=29522 RepID=A0A5C8EZD5_9SPIR|nr:type II toxin-antitoxin system YafQ family toxin [Brachyspira aalborgi]TXJ42768.1 type II toxin-antitoxin system YafQ family toxin [Brachyspira aalborgi]